LTFGFSYESAPAQTIAGNFLKKKKTVFEIHDAMLLTLLCLIP